MTRWSSVGSVGSVVALLLSARLAYSKISDLPNVSKPLPLIVTTWSTDGFITATARAWDHLQKTHDRVGAVVEGCSACEELQCDTTVGYGGSPDESGETTLEALLLDGPGQRMGAVGDLRRVKSAARVAYAVMNYTKHSFLVGESATKFAIEMGFREENLSTPLSMQMWDKWKNGTCQPNYRKNVMPDPREHCGPYHLEHKRSKNISNEMVKGSEWNHDTIGMIVIDGYGDVAAGTSTNGASHKIPGRVGDSPIPGSGAYVDNTVGAAAGTGDGDVMMRFLPSYQAVESMRNGAHPTDAAKGAIARIAKFYPNFSGAVIAADRKGRYGAACHGIKSFRYCVYNNEQDHVQLITVDCV